VTTPNRVNGGWPHTKQICQNLSKGPERPDFFFRADLWRVGPRSGGICFSLAPFQSLATAFPRRAQKARTLQQELELRRPKSCWEVKAAPPPTCSPDLK